MERLDILTRLLKGMPRAPDVSIKAVATQTAAMVASDLVNLVNLAQSTSLKRVRSSLYVPEPHCRST
jgi:peroxin-6